MRTLLTILLLSVTCLLNAQTKFQVKTEKDSFIVSFSKSAYGRIGLINNAGLITRNGKYENKVFFNSEAGKFSFPNDDNFKDYDMVIEGETGAKVDSVSVNIKKQAIIDSIFSKNMVIKAYYSDSSAQVMTVSQGIIISIKKVEKAVAKK
jgi:hypothetical protein